MAGRTFTFKINEATPDQIPAVQLANFIKDLVALFGEESGVHLVGIAPNSTSAALLVDEEAVPALIQRVEVLGSPDAPSDVLEPFSEIDSRLRRLGYSADFLDENKNKVIEFPGIKAEKLVIYPPLIQAATVEGIPIRVGGKDLNQKMVPVHLQDGQQQHYCIASRDNAAEIAEGLFKKFIRAIGEARWKRTIDGEWVRYRFTINSFDPLDDVSLPAVVDRLRDVTGSGWSKVENADAELRSLRDGGEDGSV